MMGRFDEKKNRQGHLPNDELGEIKSRLRHLERDIAFETLHRYPKTSIVLAFTAGAAFARVPFARRLIWPFGLWMAKQALSDLGDSRE